MLNTLTDNGNTQEVDYSGKVHLHISGTFSSATCALQFKGSDGSWRTISGASYTAAADNIIELGPSVYRLRVNVSGASSPDLDIMLL